MRSIKFRGWCADCKEMDMDIGTLCHKNFKDTPDNVPPEIENTELGAWHIHGEKPDYRETELILMQFTGLNDKNGKEIWEGDIVKVLKIDYESGEKSYNIEQIYWDKTDACFGTSKTDELLDGASNWEIIGNIYEHPELVKKEG